MDLIALLSSGKGSWAQVSGLVKMGDWEKVILVGDSFANNFKIETKKTEFVKVNLSQGLKELKKEFSEKLKGKIDGLEVALSIASGSGKEHMALISSIIDLPLGIKFTALTKDGIVFL